MPGSLLFPDPPREFVGKRTTKIALRAVHVLCVAALFGAHAYEAEPVARQQALLLAIGSGCSLLLLDLFESAAFFCQLRGLVLLTKLAALLLLLDPVRDQSLLLGALILISVLSSHAPSRVRYFVWLGRGRVRGARSSG